MLRRTKRQASFCCNAPYLFCDPRGFAIFPLEINVLSESPPAVRLTLQRAAIIKMGFLLIFRMKTGALGLSQRNLNGRNEPVVYRD
jgi:hypothetical protein